MIQTWSNQQMLYYIMENCWKMYNDINWDKVCIPKVLETWLRQRTKIWWRRMIKQHKHKIKFWNMIQVWSFQLITLDSTWHMMLETHSKHLDQWQKHCNASSFDCFNKIVSGNALKGHKNWILCWVGQCPKIAASTVFF